MSSHFGKMVDVRKSKIKVFVKSFHAIPPLVHTAIIFSFVMISCVHSGGLGGFFVHGKDDSRNVLTNEDSDNQSGNENLGSVRLRRSNGGLSLSFGESEDELINDDIGLAGSNLPYMGRIEVAKSDHIRGMICSEAWTIEDATVACRQLGFLPSAVMVRKSEEFGYAGGSVNMAKVKCLGDENALEDCPSLELDDRKSPPCSKYMTGAAVTCGCPQDDAEHIISKCFLYSGYLLSSLTCHYSCPKGMVLIGDKSRTCNEQHSWTGMKPFCQNVLESRRVCKIAPQNRKPCHRDTSASALSREYCISLGCCYNPSLDGLSPACYLPADSPCMIYHCKNGAQCRDRHGSSEFECVCSDNFGGRSCQYEKKGSCGIQQITPNLFSPRRFRRVIGGQRVIPGSWPWVVRIRSENTHICGGTLIHQQWILTAAHCLKSIRENHDILTVELPQDPSNLYVSKLFKVLSIRNANYTNDLVPLRDIALLKLERSVELNYHTNILCLPRSYSEGPIPSSKCWIAGWGENGEMKNQSDNFFQADIPIISNRNCQAKQSYNNHYDQINNDMICAGYTSGGVDACAGDSGGPLMCNRNDGTWYIAGVVSWGYACGDADSPGVYTRVSHFLDWIYSVIYEEEH